ncbi:MAG: ASCH domain-containing protein [Actinomycetota bacterium]
MPFPVVDGLRSAEIGTQGEMRARLNALILAGTKRATAGLRSEYETEGEPVEHVGELLALVDDELRRVATLRVTRVEHSRFADVPDSFALAEGEGDRDGDEFRAGHYRFWTSQGETITDDTMLVLVYFELVEGIEPPA